MLRKSNLNKMFSLGLGLEFSGKFYFILTPFSFLVFPPVSFFRVSTSHCYPSSLLLSSSASALGFHIHGPEELALEYGQHSIQKNIEVGRNETMIRPLLCRINLS